MTVSENTERYNSFNSYLKRKYGCKIYKLSLNIGTTCPNRDGTKGTGGCIFCHGGSGAFTPNSSVDIVTQIELAKQKVISKTKDNKFIAYFQAYTNTYAPIDYLKDNFYKAINHKDIVAISIATRPDCLPDNVIKLLSEINKIKPVTVELGLQTIHENTAVLINRGYVLQEFDNAVEKLKKEGIEVVVHVILGLPFETKNDILMTIKHLNNLKIDGIKLQLLHVLKNTKLCEMYENGIFETMTMEEYVDLLCVCVEHLSPEIVIQRLTGDAPKSLLVSPKWSADKKKVLNTIKKEFNARNIIQGRLHK